MPTWTATTGTPAAGCPVQGSPATPPTCTAHQGAQNHGVVATTSTAPKYRIPPHCAPILAEFDPISVIGKCDTTSSTVLLHSTAAKYCLYSPVTTYCCNVLIAHPARQVSDAWLSMRPFQAELRMKKAAQVAGWMDAGGPEQGGQAQEGFDILATSNAVVSASLLGGGPLSGVRAC
jgi:hypothetical protein